MARHGDEHLRNDTVAAQNERGGPDEAEAAAEGNGQTADHCHAHVHGDDFAARHFVG